MWSLIWPRCVFEHVAQWSLFAILQHVFCFYGPFWYRPISNWIRKWNKWRQKWPLCGATLCLMMLLSESIMLQLRHSCTYFWHFLVHLGKMKKYKSTIFDTSVTSIFASASEIRFLYSQGFSFLDSKTVAEWAEVVGIEIWYAITSWVVAGKKRIPAHESECVGVMACQKFHIWSKFFAQLLGSRSVTSHVYDYDGERC